MPDRLTSATMRATAIMTGLMLLALAASGAAMLPAQEGGQSLRGLKAVVLTVEGVPGDFRRYGLSAKRVREKVAQALRAGGLDVVERVGAAAAGDTALLELKLYSVFTSYGDYYSYSLSLRIRQSVPLPQGQGAALPVTTWSTGTSGNIIRTRLYLIEDYALQLVDDFLRRYYAQNPGTAPPGGLPPRPPVPLY